MSYRELYQAVQNQTGHIKTGWLCQQALGFSTIVRVREQWSAVIEPMNVRGFYIEGPMTGPIPLAEREALITLSRSMCRDAGGKEARRFIYTKELMHVFDTDDEKAFDRKTFDAQMARFADHNAKLSDQYRAEVNAYYRALGVLCTETRRHELKAQLDGSAVSLEVAAAAVKIPLYAAQWLFRDNFDALLSDAMGD